MSYDITIRSDENHSQKTNPGLLQAYLMSLSNVEMNGTNSYVYGNGKRLYMELDLEEVDAEGNWIEESELVNCISVHIPYAFMTSENKRQYLNISAQIAHHLNWQAIDAQTGNQIEAEAEPASA